MYLTIVDTTQIQSYIFGSNRLRENLGASHLVAQATGQWALDAVRKATSSHNVLDSAKPEFDTQRKIEADDTQQAEVIYTGGGNAVILFLEKDHVDNFTRKLSRSVLEKAPGLRLVISWLEFDWRQDSLARKMKELFAELGKEKRSIRASAPLLGLGVTVECHVTALPAVEMMEVIEGEEPRPVSAETAAKLNAVVPAKERLTEVLDQLPDEYDYPDRMDHLGRSTGDQSHFAVVHADGDNMGRRIESLGEKYCSPDENGNCSTGNRHYLDALRAFSQAVNDAARDALKKTLNRLTEAIEPSIDGDRLIAHRSARSSAVDWIPPVKLAAEKGKSGSTRYWYVPFRPVVFGGDDVTFVCDGRLGVTLANIYVEEFAKETGKHGACGGKLTACAGVAIVKAHYPFARAYQLAERLIHSAKNYRREIRSQPHLKDWEGACLDWHFAMSGLSGSLEEIREREYQSGKLLLRPLTLAENPYEEHRSWKVEDRLLSDFQTSVQWAGKRNKMKALREKLREREAAVREFLSLYELGKLPDTGLRLTDGHRKSGWEQGRCLYFDAIEMADWHIPLPEESPQGEKRNGD